MLAIPRFVAKLWHGDAPLQSTNSINFLALPPEIQISIIQSCDTCEVAKLGKLMSFLSDRATLTQSQLVCRIDSVISPLLFCIMILTSVTTMIPAFGLRRMNK